MSLSSKVVQTPIPYRFERQDPKDFSGIEAWGDCYALISANEQPVKELYVGFVLKEADAAAIVRACNSHDELVNALAAIRTDAKVAARLHGTNGATAALSRIASKCEATLAKATAQT